MSDFKILIDILTVVIVIIVMIVYLCVKKNSPGYAQYISEDDVHCEGSRNYWGIRPDLEYLFSSPRDVVQKCPPPSYAEAMGSGYVAGDLNEPGLEPNLITERLPQTIDANEAECPSTEVPVVKIVESTARDRAPE